MTDFRNSSISSFQQQFYKFKFYLLDLFVAYLNINKICLDYYKASHKTVIYKFNIIILSKYHQIV